LTLTDRLFDCVYTMNGGYTSGYKISYSKIIYLYLYMRQKWPYLTGQARVGLGHI
jgi:hypothetical protein